LPAGYVTGDLLFRYQSRSAQTGQQRWQTRYCADSACACQPRNAIDRAWRSRSEVVLSFSKPQASFFSSVESLLQAMERGELPLEQQRSMAGRALRTLNLLADNVHSAPERQQVARYIYRFAAASEQWTFISDEAAASFAHAAALLWQEEQSAAALLLRRALAIWQRLYGPRHELVLTAEHNLATLLEETGAYAEAERLLLQVITARTQLLPADRQAIAISIHNLARLYARQEKWEEASALYRRALRMAEEVRGENQAFTITVRYNLALLYMQWLTAEGWSEHAQDHLAEAEALLSDIYAFWQSTQGSEDLATTHLLQQLATLLAGQEKWAEAQAAFQRVLANYAPA
jgi:tetratricopeptide (TPR) repeat protein